MISNRRRAILERRAHEHAALALRREADGAEMAYPIDDEEDEYMREQLRAIAKRLSPS